MESKRRLRAQAGLASSLLLVLGAGCPAPATSGRADAGRIAARWDGGTISESELLREAGRLPPGLREQFQTTVGKREFVRSMVDKQLLYAEARRRGILDRDDIRRQVRETEERLSIQALMAEEERSWGTPTVAELRAAYEADPSVYRTPERVHVARVLALTSTGAAPAKARLAALRTRVVKGEPVAKVAAAGEGPEKVLGGDFGWVVAGGGPEKVAAMQLKKVGEVSGLIETPAGLAFFVLLERQEARTPPFEEVQGAVAARLAPTRQRKSFDELVGRLRQGAQVVVDGATP